MTERLLCKNDVAAMLGTSPGVAVSILAEHGIYPIDFGRGRSRGRRWLESAVRQLLLEMHQAAQPKPRKPRAPKPVVPSIPLANLSVGEIFRLTHSQCVQ